jgi:hypothetical protein
MLELLLEALEVIFVPTHELNHLLFYKWTQADGTLGAHVLKAWRVHGVFIKPINT